MEDINDTTLTFPWNLTQMKRHDTLLNKLSGFSYVNGGQIMSHRKNTAQGIAVYRNLRHEKQANFHPERIKPFYSTIKTVHPTIVGTFHSKHYNYPHSTGQISWILSGFILWGYCSFDLSCYSWLLIVGEYSEELIHHSKGSFPNQGGGWRMVLNQTSYH